jgi:hypothetical protein
VVPLRHPRGPYPNGSGQVTLTVDPAKLGAGKSVQVTVALTCAKTS